MRGSRLVRGHLILHGIRTRLLLRFMVTDGATSRRTEHAMMARHMPCYAANRGAAQTADSGRRLAGKTEKYCSADENRQFDHLIPRMNVGTVLDPVDNTQRATSGFDPARLPCRVSSPPPRKTSRPQGAVAALRAVAMGEGEGPHPLAGGVSPKRAAAAETQPKQADAKQG
jgi:hypothetical protein